MHQAKGLEWPVVFVPSLTAKRFPSGRTGQAGDWLVPTHLFDVARYEGADADERRLFYVAMTRARDWLSLSRHERITQPRPALARITSRSTSPGPTPDRSRCHQRAPRPTRPATSPSC